MGTDRHHEEHEAWCVLHYVDKKKSLELFSKWWSEIFDVLLLMKHLMAEAAPNLRNSYSPASSVSLQGVAVVNGGWPQLVVMGWCLCNSKLC